MEGKSADSNNEAGKEGGNSHSSAENEGCLSAWENPLLRGGSFERGIEPMVFASSAIKLGREGKASDLRYSRRGENRPSNRQQPFESGKRKLECASDKRVGSGTRRSKNKRARTGSRTKDIP